jgi:hypothetical protein
MIYKWRKVVLNDKLHGDHSKGVLKENKFMTRKKEELYQKDINKKDRFADLELCVMNYYKKLLFYNIYLATGKNLDLDSTISTLDSTKKE